MALVTVSNQLSSKFAVPPPVSRVLGPGQSVTVRLSASEIEDLGPTVASGAIVVTAVNDPNTPDSIEGALLGVVSSTIRDISLSAAAEAANAIVVTGAVTNGAGTAVEAIADVLVEVFCPTVAKGAITVTIGTQKVNIAPGATEVSRCWLKTTALGAFAVSVADDIAETVLVKATADNGACTMLMLTFT